MTVYSAAVIAATTTAKNDTAATTLTINSDAGTVAGDLLMIFISVKSASAITPPAGLTLLSRRPAVQTSSTALFLDAISGHRSQVYYGYAAGSGAQSFAFTTPSARGLAYCSRVTGGKTSGDPTNGLGDFYLPTNVLIARVMGIGAYKGFRLFHFMVTGNGNNNTWATPVDPDGVSWLSSSMVTGQTIVTGAPLTCGNNNPGGMSALLLTAVMAHNGYTDERASTLTSTGGTATAANAHGHSLALPPTAFPASLKPTPVSGWIAGRLKTRDVTAGRWV